MNFASLNTWRIAFLAALVPLAANGSEWAWVVAIPWAILNLVGILCTIPVLLGISAMAAGAQADWMSDGFVFFVFLVLPTILSVVASCLFQRLLERAPLSVQSGQVREEIESMMRR